MESLLREPGMFFDFVDGCPFPRNFIQHLADQGMQIRVDEVEWFLKLVRSPSAVIRVECTCPRCSLGQHFDQDDGARPNVGWFCVVALFSWHLHFRSHEFIRAAGCQQLCRSLICPELDRNTKVSDFDVAVRADEEIFRIDVSVRDTHKVQVLDAQDQISEILAAGGGRQTSGGSFDCVIQAASS